MFWEFSLTRIAVALESNSWIGARIPVNVKK